MRTHFFTPHEIADRVLSGLPVGPTLVTAPAVTIDPTRREPKLCEFCARTFTRPIGTDTRTCSYCGPRPEMPRKAKTRYRYTLIKNVDLAQVGTSRAYRMGRRATALYA